MRKIIVVIFILLAIVTVGWYWAQVEPVAVITHTVALGLVEASVANTRAGTVKACRRAHLSPPGSGQVSVLNVHEGDEVKAGQILLELWNVDLRARLRLSESELAVSRSHSEEVCLKADQVRREAERLRPLRRNNLVSAEQLERAETEVQIRAAACHGARVSEQVKEAQVAVAQAALERTILRAPFAGVVAELNGEIGEIVTPSPIGVVTPPAIDLINCGCVYVNAPIDEVDAPVIQAGMQARITLDAFADKVFAGTVRRTAPYVLDVEKQARTLDVEVDFDSPDQCGGLLPGYSADIEVILESRPATPRIPTEAVLEGNRVLLLGSDNYLHERSFTPGLSNWRFTEVTEGIAAGEQVVVSLDREGVVAGVAAVAEP